MKVLDFYEEKLKSYSLSKTVCAQAIDFIEKQWPLYFNWFDLSQDECAAGLLLTIFLASFVKIADDETQWDELAALEALNQHKDVCLEAKKLYLFGDPLPGMQEKYCKSQLGAYERLTPLDMKRLLVYTDMAKAIDVLPFEAQAIGLMLHQIRLNHQETREPYTRFFLLHHPLNPAGGWYSLKCDIDPVTDSITYALASDSPLSEEQFARREKSVQDALRFYAVSERKKAHYAAFPNARIYSSPFISYEAGRLGCYLLVHKLFQDPTLASMIAGKPEAKAIVLLADDAFIIAKKINELMLKRLSIKESEKHILAPAIQRCFDGGRLKEAALGGCLTRMETLVNKRVFSPQHPAVTDQLATFRLTSQQLVFPSKKTRSPLSRLDYQQFLYQLYEKFQHAGIKTDLDELTIVCDDYEAIAGLILYGEQAISLPCQRLIIDLRGFDEDQITTSSEEILFYFKNLLLVLEDIHLPSLAFVVGDKPEDKRIHWLEALAFFARDRRLAIDIDLPKPLAFSKTQRALDEVTSVAIETRQRIQLEKISTNLLKPPVALSPPRTRQKKAKQASLMVDIELHQEQQIETAASMPNARLAEPTSSSLNFSEVASYTSFSWEHMLQTGEGLSDDMAYLLIPTANDSLHRTWGHWVGALSLAHMIANIRLSTTACKQLLRYAPQFQQGIDFNHLPPGFIIYNEGDVDVLHFDEGLKRTAIYHPLQIQNIDAPALKPLPESMFNTWLARVEAGNPLLMLWQQLDRAPLYDKKAHRLFKQLLPEALLLPPQAQQHLAALVMDENHTFDGNKYQFLLQQAIFLKQYMSDAVEDKAISRVINILFPTQLQALKDYLEAYEKRPATTATHLLFLLPFMSSLQAKIKVVQEKIPSLNLNALLQTYITAGEEAVKTLLERMEKSDELFKQLHEQVFVKLPTYAPLLTPAYEEAIEALRGLSPPERLWWDTLLSAHSQAQEDGHLVPLVDAFKWFKKELAALPTPDGKPLTFPAVCRLTGVKSLPVTLSRLLTLLKHVDEENRLSQWLAADGLDLSSSGMIQALSNPPPRRAFAFITKEMQLHAAAEREGADFTESNVIHYQGSRFWQEIAEQSATQEETVKRFFRYVALQGKEAQLPLFFYRHVKQAIEEKVSFSERSKKCLYALFASATTRQNKENSQDVKQAIKDVDVFITQVNRLPSLVRENALQVFLKLKEIPPLPLLNQLMSVLSSSISTLFKARVNSARLNQAAVKLKQLVEQYGVCVYQSMKDYQAVDFKKDHLFFHQLTLIEKAKHLFGSLPYLSFVISIISSFHLDEKTLEQLKQHRANDQPQVMKEVLSLLAYLSVHHHPTQQPLQWTDLQCLLDHVMNHAELPVVEGLKTLVLSNNQQLVDYFSPHFLDNYGKKGIDEVVLKKLSLFTTCQQKQLKQLVLRFAEPGDALYYECLVDQIIAICTPLSLFERNIFLNQLVLSDDLYNEPATLETHAVMALLRTIYREQRVDDFINVMIAKKTQQVPALATKLTVFLQTILPAVVNMANWPLPLVELMPSLHQTLFHLPMVELKDGTPLVDLYKKINHLLQNNPNSGLAFLTLYDRYLSYDEEAENGHYVAYLNELVDTLESVCDDLDDKGIFLSLCSLLKSHEEPPHVLLAWLKEVSTLKEQEQRATVLHITVVLDSSRDISRFKELTQCVKENKVFYQHLKALYEKGPYLSLDDVLYCHQQAEKQILPREQVQLRENPDSSFSPEELVKNKTTKDLLLTNCPATYDFYYKTKFVGVIKQCKGIADYNRHYTFDSDKAKAQRVKFSALGSLLNDTDIDNLSQKIIDVRRAPNHEILLSQFKGMATEAVIDYGYLVAIAAELLYRSTKIELNTTQYLAVLSLLQSPTHAISQIATGEGKSRIMMVVIACQFALGKTVDFVTSNLALATRDLITYKAYFDLINANTCLIQAYSPTASYLFGGIHFSDLSHLSLFRNKARSFGLGAHVLQPDEEKRALLLDEADRALYDMADTRFNFSIEADKSIQDMPWVYPLLIDYFAQTTIVLDRGDGQVKQSPLALYYQNVDASREHFLQFAAASCSMPQLMRLKALSNEQIEQWQVAAVTAYQLQFKKEFVIKPGVLIQTATGLKMVSEAQLLFANQVLAQSKYAFGVHQCLHARLNKLLHHVEEVEDEAFRQALSQCQQPFFIADEKQIVCSSTSFDLFKDYQRGTIKGVSGTVGSLLEREEACYLYGLSQAYGTEPLRFIDVPRHIPLRRHDQGVRLTANTSSQTQALIEQITEARAKNQPVLIISENEKESAFFFRELQKKWPDAQHIHSELTVEEESAFIVRAGHPQQITVSTDRVGRGTDIRPQGRARDYGLYILLTYLPTSRDYQQVVGRSGRYGDNGESSIILNVESFPTPIDKNALYHDAEAYLKQQQTLMERVKQQERLIKIAMDRFRQQFDQVFFNHILPYLLAEEKQQLNEPWAAFFKQCDESRYSKWLIIKDLLAHLPVQWAAIQTLLSEYEQKVKDEWDSFQLQIARMSLTPINDKHPSQLLTFSIQPLVLDMAFINRLTTAGSRQEAPAVTIYDKYHPGHDGRAVRYKHWYTPFIASLKGYANLLPFVHFSNARKPFANTRAWLAGHGQLFPQWRASRHRGKIAGAFIAGLIGGCLGVALLLTGVLAPLGVAVLGMSSLVTSALIFASAGLAGGAFIGLGAGSLVDRTKCSTSAQVLAAASEQPTTTPSSSYARMFSVDDAAPEEAQSSPTGNSERTDNSVNYQFFGPPRASFLQNESVLSASGLSAWPTASSEG